MTRSEIIVAKTSLILATILILCFSSFAEESLITAYADGAYIHGTVKKSDGKPLQYAEVMVKGTSEGTTTDKAGRFTLKIPESAESILTASYTGYMPKSIIVAPGDDNVNIVLAEDFTRLGEIVVTATRTPKTLSESPVITRIITENDIVRQNPANVSELLQSELPGIEFRFAMNQQTSIDMQGFGGTSVLFLIDGERMSGETLDNVDYSRINTDNIQRIEIVKGAGSSLYGSNAIGAVVNIITKENKLPWSLSLSSQYGGRKDYENKMAPNLRNNMTWGLNLGKWNNLLTFQHADNAGCSLPAGDFTKIYGNYSLQLNDHLKYKISKRISLIGRYSCFFRQRDYQETDKDRYRDFNGGVKMTWQPDESNNLEAGWSIDQYDKSDYYTRNKKDICDYSNIQNSIRVFYTHTLSHGNSISAGGDYMNDYLMSYQFKDDSSHSQNIIDLFAQYDWNISDRLNLVTSLRSDYYSLSGFNISPRISIKFKAADKLTHEYHEVAALQVLLENFDCVFLRTGDEMRIAVPALFRGIDDELARNSRNGLFAGLVNFADEEFVAVRERGAESFILIAGARIKMRLEHDDDALVRELVAGTGESRGGFRRVVRIVIIDEHALFGADVFKAAMDARKFSKDLAHRIERNALLVRKRDSRGRIQHIVAARNLEREFADGLSGLEHFKAGNSVHIAKVFNAVHRLTVESVSHDGFHETRKHGLDIRIIEADDNLSVKRNFVRKSDKGVLDFFDVAVSIEVIRVDVRDDRGRGHHREEAAVEFIAFRDEIIAAADLGAAALALHDAADDDRRVLIGGFPDGAEHGSCSGLSVRAGNSERVFEAHQFAEHFRAADDRDAARFRFHDFGIVHLDRGRVNEEVSALDVLRFMLRKHLYPEILQVIDDRAFAHVRARNDEAVFEKDFGDTGHTGAADAHHVKSLDPVFRDDIHFAHSASKMTLAILSAASGIPSACAAFAILFSSSVFASRFSTFSQRWSGSSSSSTRAAPAFSTARALNSWWFAVANGYGRRTEGLPNARISASVEAPARLTITSA